MKHFKYITHLISATCIFFICACNSSDSAKGSQAEFYVRGNCDMCKERIEGAVNKLPGIQKAEWSVESKNLSVSFDSTKTTLDKIKKTVAGVGHETKEIKADQAAYDQLHICCKKPEDQK